MVRRKRLNLPDLDLEELDLRGRKNNFVVLKNLSGTFGLESWEDESRVLDPDGQEQLHRAAQLDSSHLAENADLNLVLVSSCPPRPCTHSPTHRTRSGLAQGGR